MASRLSSISFFRFLLEPALKKLEECFVEYRFEENDLVYFPDEIPEGFLWITEGCLLLETQDGATTFRGVGESIGSATWWKGQKSGLFVKGKTPGTYLVFLRSKLLNWARAWKAESHELNRLLDEKYALTLDEWGKVVQPAPRSVQKYPHLLESEENPVQQFRKSSIRLTLSLFLPSLLALLALAYAAFVQRVVPEVAVQTGVWLFVSLVEAVCLVWIVLVLWEWKSSLILVTDRSILMKELDLGKKKSSFHKIPLEKVREVIFRKSNWFQSLFHLVHLEVSSDGHSGKIDFPGLDENESFLETFRHLKEQRLQVLGDKTTIREKLSQKFGSARRPKRVGESMVPPSAARRSKLSWRWEKNGVVSYRRHSWHWWKKAFRWWGVLALTAFVTGLATAAAPQWTAAMVGCGLVIGMVPIGRLLWDWVDWTNDRLMIEGSKIVAIHKKPLWLGEVRQEGELLAIQHIGIRKETIGALVMDFGDVVISLGTEQDLVFECASHPQAVQEEIFQRRRSVEVQKNEESAGKRVEEVAEILKTYEEAKSQDFFKKDPT